MKRRNFIAAISALVPAVLVSTSVTVEPKPSIARNINRDAPDEDSDAVLQIMRVTDTGRDSMIMVCDKNGNKGTATALKPFAGPTSRSASIQYSRPEVGEFVFVYTVENEFFYLSQPYYSKS
jgi:hypothetical protein